MSAHIISVANQKGGSGKTTLVMQIGGALGLRGSRVLIVDADPQATATRWAAAASDTTPYPAAIAGLSAAGEKVHREVRKYIDSYDFIFIDCPPSIESVTPKSALLVSDIVLVPVMPSPPDLWASAGMVRLIEETRAVNEQLKAFFVLNQHQPNRILASEVADVLNQFGIAIMLQHLGNREPYRQSPLQGGTVHSLGARAAAAIAEVEALTNELVAHLKEKGSHGQQFKEQASAKAQHRTASAHR